MSSLLLLTTVARSCADVLPALELLAHSVRIAPAEATVALDIPPIDAIVVDGRQELPHIRNLCRVFRTMQVPYPLLLVTTEGGLAAVTTEWGVDDVLLPTAGPAEVEARLRLAIGRRPLVAETPGSPQEEISSGALTINEANYTAKLRGRVLDLTFKEFELLKYLASHPGRVFTRVQLLQQVWGYDYFGGTRTVDVHVRRLRAKLGVEHEALIGTVRHVGYRFAPSPVDGAATG